MSIVRKIHTVWSYTTGRVAGADHLPTGELYRGHIYFRQVDTVGGVYRIILTLSNGNTLHINNGETSAQTAGVQVHLRGVSLSGEVHLEVVPRGSDSSLYEGIRTVGVQAYYRTSPSDYNPLSFAAFLLWKGAGTTQSGVTVEAGQKRGILDNTAEDVWENAFIDRDGEVITFAEHMGDRFVDFSFTTDILPQPTATENSPYAQFVIQLRRADDTIVASSPVVYIHPTSNIKARQVNLTVFIHGEEDHLVKYGVIPEVVNVGQAPVTFRNSSMQVFSVDSPSNQYLMLDRK